MAALMMRSPQLATGTRLQARPVPCPTIVPRVAQRPGCNVQAKAAAATAGTVKLIIQGRKLPVTDAIRQYVESKIGHAAQHFQQTIKEVDVTLSARGGDTGTKGEKKQKVDVTIYTLRNGVVRVEDTDQTLYAAIDKAADKIERKMTRVKEKAILKGKWPGRAGPHVDKAEQEEFQEYLAEVQFFTSVSDNAEALDREFAELNAKYPATVLRQKVIALDPMSVDEAIDALEAIGHSFYVFREIESDTVQVLYKRVSEGYGIIVPTKRD